MIKLKIIETKLYSLVSSNVTYFLLQDNDQKRKAIFGHIELNVNFRSHVKLHQVKSSHKDDIINK